MKSMANYGAPTMACGYDWPDHPNLWPTIGPPLWLVVMTGQTIQIYGPLWGPHYGLYLWLATPSKYMAHYEAPTMACGYDWPDHPNLWPTMGPPLLLVVMTGQTIQIYGSIWGPHYCLYLWLARPSKYMAHYEAPTMACGYDWPGHPNIWLHTSGLQHQGYKLGVKRPCISFLQKHNTSGSGVLFQKEIVSCWFAFSVLIYFNLHQSSSPPHRCLIVHC